MRRCAELQGRWNKEFHENAMSRSQSLAHMYVWIQESACVYEEPGALHRNMFVPSLEQSTRALLGGPQMMHEPPRTNLHSAVRLTEAPPSTQPGTTKLRCCQPQEKSMRIHQSVWWTWVLFFKGQHHSYGACAIFKLLLLKQFEQHKHITSKFVVAFQL